VRSLVARNVYAVQLERLSVSVNKKLAKLAHVDPVSPPNVAQVANGLFV